MMQRPTKYEARRFWLWLGLALLLWAVGLLGVVALRNRERRQEIVTVPYIVQPGDTLWTIAPEYCGRHDKREWIWFVRFYNGRGATEVLHPTQRLVVPDWGKS